MKLKLFPILFLLISTYAHAQNYDKNWEQLDLKNKPKSVKTISSVNDIETVFFNKKGYVEKRINECECATNMLAETEYSYSQDNKVKEQITRREGVLSEHITYKYNSDGESIPTYILQYNGPEEVIFSERGPTNTEKKFNEKQQLVELILSYKNNEIIDLIKYVYVYDKKGNWISDECYSKKDGTTDFTLTNKIIREIKY